MIREMCAKYLNNNLNMIYAYLTTVNAHDKPLGELSDSVIVDIKAKNIFKGINYDLESVVTQDVNLQEFGENSKELVVQLLEKVKDYKAHVLEQLDGVYEDIKFKLESYYRNQIKQMNNPNIESENNFDPAEALTKITNEHREMLIATREQYAAQMTRIEQDHQLILQKLMKTQGVISNDSESNNSATQQTCSHKQVKDPEMRTLKDCIVGNKSSCNTGKQQAIEGNCKSVLRITPASSSIRSIEGENRTPIP